MFFFDFLFFGDHSLVYVLLKVFDLQSRYKSDKRFVLDERFVEDEAEDEGHDDEQVELEQIDEKTRQLNILQNVLGVAVKSNTNKDADHKKLK